MPLIDITGNDDSGNAATNEKKAPGVITYTTIKAPSGIKLFTWDYSRQNGQNLKRNQMTQNANREFHAAVNAYEIKERYETLATEIARLNLNVFGDKQERSKIEALKTKLKIPEQYIDQNLLDHYLHGSSSPAQDSPSQDTNNQTKEV